MTQRYFKLTMLTAAAAAMIFLTGAPAMAEMGKDQERVEARITDMHAKLGITADEEAQWSKVADIMRDNAKQMDALTDERMSKGEKLDAIDDLESYGEIAEAHADGIRKLTPVFATLYDNMTEDQKDEADELFKHGQHHKGHHHVAD